MATILITHGVPAEGFHTLEGHRIIMPAPLQAYTMQELSELIADADAVVAGGKLPGYVIRLGSKLRIIANYGIQKHTLPYCKINEPRIYSSYHHRLRCRYCRKDRIWKRRICPCSIRAQSCYGYGKPCGILP